MKFVYLTAGLFCLLIGSAVSQPNKEEFINDEDDSDVKVEDDSPAKEESLTPTGTDKDLDPEEEAAKGIVRASKDVETSILFTQPPNTKDFVASGIIKILIGFFNKGENEFFVENLAVSFRYPMDYSFHIQNYTDAVYNRLVKSNTEATFDYSFLPGEVYAGRPFGLSIILHYSDLNETRYASTVYNETVNIIEDESGFNPETGFLYVVFACIAILLLVFGQQFLSKMRRKHGMAKRVQPVEMGTTKNGDIDYEWIPKELLKAQQSPQAKKEHKNNQTRK